MLTGDRSKSPLTDPGAVRVRLESLSTKDLIKMADSFGVEIPLDLDRIFIIEELLDIISSSNHEESSSDITANFLGETQTQAETDVASLVEPVPLPKQYNITFIDVLIRDPFWAFVFWEIKAQDKEYYEKSEDFEGYYLKVSPLKVQTAQKDETGKAKGEAQGVFTVTINANDTTWYLGLSHMAQKEKQTDGHVSLSQQQYKVELCVEEKSGETVLAVSSPFSMPVLRELPTRSEAHSFAAENPLVMLSGYEDFSVVRKKERFPRVRRSAVNNNL
ncbi:MAG: DUF4912 domain-containing protein [Treponema sp.]|nr:DUF4912 domain-containing protein [Treponema sp.]